MGINFPSSPAWQQVHNVSPGVSYVWEFGWKPAPIKTAMPKNYIVNPSMQHSQQNGDTTLSSGAGVVSGGYYPADQWYLYHAGITGVAIATLGQVVNVNNINRWIQFYTNNGPVTTAAGDYAQARTYIEGQRCADFKWGTAGAKDAILRFDGLFPTGQKFYVCIGTLDRYYLFPFTGNGGYQTHTFVVPGLTTGTFNTDTTYGLFININAVAGSNYHGVEGSWQAAPHKYGTATGGSFIRGSGSTFTFSNVGLYLDPYKTGVAPPYEHPDIFEELRRCQRYWAKLYIMRGWVTSATQVTRASQQLPVPMRIPPALAAVGVPKIYDGTASANLGAIQTQGSNEFVAELNAAVGTLTAARPAIHFWDSDANYIAANARM